MRKLTMFSLCLSVIAMCYSQEAKKSTQLNSHIKADASLQGIGVSCDLRAGKNTTIELATGVGGGYDIAEGFFNYTWAILEPALYFYASPKFFYNRKKRFIKDKRMDNNAGNYFGFRLKYNTSDVGRSGILRDAFLFNIHWGLQRPLGKRWVFYTQAGGGYALDIVGGWSTIYPAADLKFSYIISKKKTSRE